MIVERNLAFARIAQQLCSTEMGTIHKHDKLFNANEDKQAHVTKILFYML